MPERNHSDPILEALFQVRSLLDHLCIRGLQFIDSKDIKRLRTAAAYFSDIGAEHLSENLEAMLEKRESEPKQAAQHALALQARCHLFERQISQKAGLNVLKAWLDD